MTLEHVEDSDPEIYVVWNSKKKRILMCTFSEELARKVSGHYVSGMECTAIPVYHDIEDYLEDSAEEIALEAKKKLTPIEYEAIKRTLGEGYPENVEFDHEARLLYD
jgi:hypothetical protein